MQIDILTFKNSKCSKICSNKKPFHVINETQLIKTFTLCSLPNWLQFDKIIVIYCGRWARRWQLLGFQNFWFWGSHSGFTVKQKQFCLCPALFYGRPRYKCHQPCLADRAINWKVVSPRAVELCTKIMVVHALGIWSLNTPWLCITVMAA